MIKWVSVGLNRFTFLAALVHICVLVFFISRGDSYLFLPQQDKFLSVFIAVCFAIVLTVLCRKIFFVLHTLSRTKIGYDKHFIIPPLIALMGCMIFRPQWHELLEVGLVILFFIFWGHIQIWKKANNILTRQLQIAWLSLLSGFGFIFFESFIYLLFPILVACFLLLPVRKGLYMIIATVLFCAPFWIYRCVEWSFFDSPFFVVRDFSWQAQWNMLGQSLFFANSMSWAQCGVIFLLVLISVGNYAWTTFSNISFIGLHFIVFFFLVNALFFADSITHIQWSLFAAIIILLCFWSIKTAFTRLVMFILLLVLLLFL